MTTANDLVKKVTHLVSLPEVYWRVQSLVNKPNASLNEFAALVEMDPAMSAKVLAVANSAFYGFPTRIDTLRRAVNILGISHLHDLVLATSVTRAFTGIPAGLVDMQSFWSKSVRCGLIGKALAEQCKILDTDRVFLQGLLHDIGHLVLYLQIPERIAEVIKVADAQQEPLHQVERRLLGFDYAEVGGALLKSWKLPINLQESTALQLEPSKAIEFPLEAAIIHISAILSAQREYPPEKFTRIAAIDDAAWHMTELHRETAEAIADDCERALMDVLHLFVPNPKTIRSVA